MEDTEEIFDLTTEKGLENLRESFNAFFDRIKEDLATGSTATLKSTVSPGIIMTTGKSTVYKLEIKTKN